MKQFKPSVFGDTPEVEKLKESLFYSMQNDSEISETKVLFSLLKSNDSVDSYILSFMKEDNFAGDTMLFLLNEIKSINNNKLVVKATDTKEDLAVKNFMRKLDNVSRFEILTNRIFNNGSLNAVKFLMIHFEFKKERVIELVYRNTIDVFFYVFDTLKIDNHTVAKMIKEKLENDSSFFNFDIVNKLVVMEDMPVSDELINYDIMKKILIFKNFNSKEKSTHKELVKI